jgi:hypothetical protein
MQSKRFKENLLRVTKLLITVKRDKKSAGKPTYLRFQFLLHFFKLNFNVVKMKLWESRTRTQEFSKIHTKILALVLPLFVFDLKEREVSTKLMNALKGPSR